MSFWSLLPLLPILLPLPEEESLLEEVVEVVPAATPVAVGVYVIVTVVAWPPEMDIVFVTVMGVAVAVPVLVVVTLAVAVKNDKYEARKSTGVSQLAFFSSPEVLKTHTYIGRIRRRYGIGICTRTS